jgi:ABC-type nitrate/sulfonate/bicarbonate transport system substrate-binding protein
MALGARTMGMMAMAGAGGTLARSSLLRSRLGSAMTPKYGTVRLQLNWLINVQFGGSFLAESKGYYTQAGVAVDIVPGGPNVNVEPLVVQGKADVGISPIESLASARAAGADLVAIGATWQVNPNCFISLASDPVKTPKGLVGKKVGVPSDSVQIVQNFLKVNGISPSAITIVPVEFDPTPLADKEVEVYFGIITSEPITLQLQGVPTYSMLLADFGEPELTELYITTAGALADTTKRAAIKAFLEGEIRGWQDYVADPGSAVSLAVNVYGKSLHLDPKEQLLEAQAQAKIMVSPYTHAHGLLTMGPSAIAQSLHTLKLEALSATSDMFDSSLLNEIYDGKSSLS